VVISPRGPGCPTLVMSHHTLELKRAAVLLKDNPRGTSSWASLVGQGVFMSCTPHKGERFPEPECLGNTVVIVVEYLERGVLSRSVADPWGREPSMFDSSGLHSGINFVSRVSLRRSASTCGDVVMDDGFSDKEIGSVFDISSLEITGGEGICWNDQSCSEGDKEGCGDEDIETHICWQLKLID